MVYPYLEATDITVISSKVDGIMLPPNVKQVLYDLEIKANYTMNILLNALDRNFELDHDVKLIY